MADGTPRSDRLFREARQAIAGGITHENRYLGDPPFITRASGSRKWDTEGNEYVDFHMASAAMLLGHAHPDVTRAVAEQAASGVSYADFHPLELEWAQLVQELIPSADRVRFCASGTEATMLAIRLGRAASGRPKVLRFEGHYHGWHDYVALGSSAPYNRVPSLGILPAAAAATVVAPADADRVDALLAADPEIGTIIVEASGANYGCVPLPDGFLAALRDMADRRGCVLVFDEVITGFRWSPGGLQALIGVMPDLTTLAKAATGGLPGGVVAGREGIMRLMDPTVEIAGYKPGVMHRGTFNGNAMVAAGAVAALKHVRTGAPGQHADKIAARLRQGFERIMVEHQVAGAVYGESSSFHLYFGPAPARSVRGMGAAEIRGVPKALVKALRLGMRQRGVDLMSHMSGVTSWAHTEEDVVHALEAFEGTLREMIEQGLVGRA